ncbi:MAG: sulfatase-like hydrolase/transferase [Verrucomicrobiales bacterium]|nr:sulfatase-like hydrolase/transferase [Verrucomicrobiales bacterium]
MPTSLFQPLLTRTLVIAASAFLLLLSATASEKPNILFIVTDDHGWGDLPANWDQTEVQLPTLDGLAAGGARFTNYHTVPLCAPSRACMFTGQYSSENGMWRGPSGIPGTPGYKGIKRDVKMLSEFLSEAGYQTGGFGKWHMGSIEGEAPNDRGFDEYRGFMSGTHGYWVTEQRSRLLHNGEPDDATGHTTELFTEWAEGFIRESVAEEEPFFCYLAYNAVHGPIRTEESKPASAPEEWINKAIDRGVSFLRSDYVAVLEHMDHHVGKLVDVLDELKVADNTLIVFVSDNGGCTMEEGAAGGRYPGINGQFRGGKATTFQGGLSVPFLMNWKGRIPEGTVSDAQVMHADIFATLLDAAQIPLPEMNGKNPMRGLSLIPHMTSAGEEAVPERTMIFDLWGNLGLRKGNYKLWGDVGRDSTPDWEALINDIENADLSLFDLSQDPGEQTDLRADLPEVYASLKAELMDHFAGINAEYPVPESIGVKGENTPASKPKPSAPAKSSGSPISEKLFKARDQNGDGALTLQEYINKPIEESPGRTKVFKKLDADADGKLTLEELKQATK